MLTKATNRPTIRQYELFAATELKFWNTVIAGILIVAGGKITPIAGWSRYEKPRQLGDT
jgi:hypothetical protein